VDGGRDEGDFLVSSVQDREDREDRQSRQNRCSRDDFRLNGLRTDDLRKDERVVWDLVMVIGCSWICLRCLDLLILERLLFYVFLIDESNEGLASSDS
jgi:hypothetical protein